jgi:hypothetical protein
MQVLDEQDRMIISKEVDMLWIPDELSKINLATTKKIIVAPLPKEGDIMEFNGLRFEVVRILNKGRYVIKMMEAINV